MSSYIVKTSTTNGNEIVPLSFPNIFLYQTEYLIGLLFAALNGFL